MITSVLLKRGKFYTPYSAGKRVGRKDLWMDWRDSLRGPMDTAIRLNYIKR